MFSILLFSVCADMFLSGPNMEERPGNPDETKSAGYDIITKGRKSVRDEEIHSVKLDSKNTVSLSKTEFEDYEKWLTTQEMGEIEGRPPKEKTKETKETKKEFSSLAVPEIKKMNEDYGEFRKNIYPFNTVDALLKHYKKLEHIACVLEETIKNSNPAENIHRILENSNRYITGLKEDVELLIEIAKKTNPDYKKSIAKGKEQKTKTVFQKELESFSDWLTRLVNTRKKLGEREIRSVHRTFHDTYKKVMTLLEGLLSTENIVLNGRVFGFLVQEKLRTATELAFTEEKDIESAEQMIQNTVPVIGVERIVLKENAIVFYPMLQIEDARTLKEIEFAHSRDVEDGFFVGIYKWAFGGNKEKTTRFADMATKYEDNELPLGTAEKLKLRDYAALFITKLDLKNSKLSLLYIACEKKKNAERLAEAKNSICVKNVMRIVVVDYASLLLRKMESVGGVGKEVVVSCSPAAKIEKSLGTTGEREIRMGDILSLRLLEGGVHFLNLFYIPEKNRMNLLELSCKDKSLAKKGENNKKIPVGYVAEIKAINYAVFFLGNILLAEKNKLKSLVITCMNTAVSGGNVLDEAAAKKEIKENEVYLKEIEKMKDRSLDMGEVENVSLGYYAGLFAPKLLFKERNTTHSVRFESLPDTAASELLRRNGKNIMLGRVKNTPVVSPENKREELLLRLDYTIVQ
ncbi:MAG: uncharacterized protein A8A55_1026 [Amphiamblys sp. WSBS2006]|nr:MAG: uncharacterized protein A8A55_1026 [Amphiamblys sp. WSBS2006]